MVLVHAYESLSADACVELEFRDGSTVTISGHSGLTISEDEQKELPLRHVAFSVSVTPQPTGHPMLLHTPTAELKVLGTQFNVDAGSSATVLTVNEGRVRLKRLTDGDVIDVPAEHQTVASIEGQNGLALNPRDEGTPSWQSDLQSDARHGKWVSDLWTLDQRLKKAVAAGEMSEAEAIADYKDAATLDDDRGSVWAKPSVVVALVLLSVSRESATPVVMASGATFRIQGRLHSPADVVFGITTNEHGGGFAGKYTVSVSADVLRGDGNAFDIEVPLSEFRPKEPQFGNSLTGKELTDWWCNTVDKNAKLEITNVELLVP